MPQKRTQRVKSARGRRGGRGEAATVSRFVKALDDAEIMLLRLRDELYEGHWDIMLEDLRDRLQGRAYIFKLVNRIQDDIERINRLSLFEEKHKVDLARLIGE
ncbi:MAG: hypothetical protein QGD94_12155 [Planctomycetia bacterium]|nr:hypothetical protein [Planctomycetia bacterium]